MPSSALECGPVQTSNQKTEPSFMLSDSDNTSASGRQEEESYCDYDFEPTMLFKQISERRWVDVANRCVTHPEEVCTWVVRYKISNHDKQRKVRWELLPLHAALIFKGPTNIIGVMLEEYPDALKRCDDEGMLPLHRAFRQDAKNDETAILLLKYYEKHFPEGLQVKDKKGKTAIEYENSSICTQNVLTRYSKVTAITQNDDSQHTTSHQEEKVDALKVEEGTGASSVTDKVLRAEDDSENVPCKTSEEKEHEEDDEVSLIDLAKIQCAGAIKTIEDVNNSITDVMFCLPSLPDEAIKQEERVPIIMEPPESNLVELCMNVILAKRDIKKVCSEDLKKLLYGIREHLLWFDQDFANKHGRLPTREEREPMRKTYEVYSEVKDMLRLKQQPKEDIVNSRKKHKKGSFSLSLFRRKTEEGDLSMTTCSDCSDGSKDGSKDVSKDVSKGIPKSIHLPFFGRSHRRNFKNTQKVLLKKETPSLL